MVAFHVPTSQVGISNFAVMGTRYLRDQTLASEVEINSTETIVIPINHIYSDEEFKIGNTLSINLRQATESELAFVSLSNGPSSTEVIINPTGVANGSYTLILESYDENSNGSYSTLKQDTIIIIVDI